MYRDIFINRIRSVSVIIHTLIGFAVFWIVHIQPSVAYDSTYGDIICVYKYINKIKAIHRYMESLALHTGAPTVHWEDNTSCISVVESKIGVPRVKQIDINVFFIPEQFDNGLFVPKYENSSVMPEVMCTIPCLGPIISLSTKWMTGLRLYPTSDT